MMMPGRCNVHKGILVFTLLSLSSFLGACNRAAIPIKRQTMTELPHRVQPIFEKTQTVCFGRFMMQIPATATVVYGPAEVDTPIEYFEGHSEKVAEHLSARLKEVEKEREFLLKDDLETLPLFGQVIDGSVPGQKIVFGSKNQIGYTIYSFVPVGKDLFVQHLNSVLPQHDRIATINRVADSLRSRSEDEMPTEPGTCIAGGFVPLEQKYERVTLGVRLKEFPDVHFSVEVHKNQERLAESGRIELMREQARENAEQRGLGSLFARIKILRKEARQLGAWSGMEIATRTPPHENDTEAHEFRFESLGAVSDPLQPRLDVRLDSGVKNDRRASLNPSVTDEEAIAIWDKLINSIKVRPSDRKNTIPAVPPKAPLASLVGTGAICPETGWWQCTEDDNIEGGRRRHFAAGESMPYAILLGEPSLWQKLTGTRPTHKLTTVWQLVDYGAVATTPSLATTEEVLISTAITKAPRFDELPVAKDSPPSAG